MVGKMLGTGLLFCFCASSYLAAAHGGGGPESVKEKPKLKFKFKRSAPVSLNSIDAKDIDAISEGGQLPEDVVAIHCKLTGSVDCRGLTITLKDKDGHGVATSHTGTLGLVAFEGLQHHETYVAKIESEKYHGEVEVAGGGRWTLLGDRKP